MPSSRRLYCIFRGAEDIAPYNDTHRAIVGDDVSASRILSLSCKAQEIFIVARRLLIFRATRTCRTQGEKNQKQRRQNEN